MRRSYVPHSIVSLRLLQAGVNVALPSDKRLQRRVSTSSFPVR